MQSNWLNRIEMICLLIAGAIRSVVNVINSYAKAAHNIVVISTESMGLMSRLTIVNLRENYILQINYMGRGITFLGAPRV